MLILKKLLRLLLILVIVHCTFYILHSLNIVHSNVYARDFSSYYKTTYDFNDDLQANVEQEISLLNNTANYYVSQYSLSILGGNATDVTAYDKIGPLKVSTVKKDETTILNLSFNEKSVGKGSILSFILKYKIDKLAKKEGNLQQVFIPRLSEMQNIDDYSLILKIPKSYGKIANIDPSPRTQKEEKEKYVFTFEKSDLAKYGVIATFGQYQTFDFTILYELTNNEDKDYYQSVPLPPDTAYQKIRYESMIPLPDEVIIDYDGNWRADFRVASHQKVLVEAKGQVNIFTGPRKEFVPPAFTLEKYLASSQYWDTQNATVKDLAQKLKTPQNIYDYVVKTLSYNYDAVGTERLRKGSSEAVRNPINSICTEFTDLFVAICRAAGIPARELEGYAYNDNPKLKGLLVNNDVLHAWPEYFDLKKKQWIMVDPTFGNTSKGMDFFNKFDMTHFVFVIHGENDVLPYPPGSYRDENFKGRQIFIAFGKERKSTNTKLEIVEIKPEKLFSILNNQLTVKIKNTSGEEIRNEKIIIRSGSLILKETDSGVIPPFSNKDLNFIIKPKEIFKDYEVGVSITTDEAQAEFKIIAYSIALRGLLFGGVLFALILLIVLTSIRKEKNRKKNEESGIMNHES